MGLRDAAGEPLKMADRLGRVADLLEDSGIPLDEIAGVQNVRIGNYQTVTKSKDADGVEVVEYHDLKADSLVIRPSWADGPEWPVIDQAAPVKIVPSRAKPAEGDQQTVVMIPDPQIGFTVDDDGVTHPFHDPAAMAAAVEVVRKTKPHVVVILGDVLDFGEWSMKFMSSPGASRTSQASIQAAHEFCAQLRAAAPLAEFHFLAGNHDDRLPKLLMANARAAFGIKRAGEPDGWPVLSVPYLLRLDELDINWVGGYPAGRVWLRSDVFAHHGLRLTAERASKDPLAVSTFQGHTHRFGLKTKTVTGSWGEPIHTVHVECGTLARIDGAVPSFGSGVTERGVPIHRVEDWQQGLVIVTLGAAEYECPAVEMVPIHSGVAHFRGTLLAAES